MSAAHQIEALTSEIVAYLDSALPRDHRCFAIADPSEISPWLREHLPGLREGVPRLAIVGHGRIYFIEILADGASLSDEREDFQSWCAVWGTSWMIARSVDDMRIALARWNIATGALA